MSWLSKALKNDAFKIGATIAAGYVANEYFFGETGTVMEGGGNPFGYGSQEYTSGNLASSFLNTVGATPFAQTGIGEVVSPYLSKLGGADGFFTSAGTELGKRFFGNEFSNMGMDVTIPGPRSFTSREQYQAGRAQQLALGKGSIVKNALAKPSMQSYLAKQVRGLGIPSVNIYKSTITTPSSTVTTTASAKRARRRLIET